jgi:hypothetical protein
MPPPVTGTRNLNTIDIVGGQCGTVNLGQFSYHKRRGQVRDLTTNEDIPGSKCGTVKRTVCTTRVTNPLEPEYQIPGQTELKSFSINDPYGAAGCSLAKNRPQTSAASTGKLTASVNCDVASQKPPSMHSSMKGSATGKVAASVHSMSQKSIGGRVQSAFAGSQSSKRSQGSRLSAAQKLDKFISA